jgi:hypothetical protein
MKSLPLTISSILLVLFLSLCSFELLAQSTLPNYRMEFEFWDSQGALRDTMMSRIKFKKWSESPSYPSYVKWKDLPFAVNHSSIDGVGLFCDSTHSFSANQVIGFAFIKKKATGHFSVDYLETNAGSFINNSDTPNAQVELSEQGVVIRAISAITPLSEITVSYQALIDLFQGDPEVVQAVKYW